MPKSKARIYTFLWPLYWGLGVLASGCATTKLTVSEAHPLVTPGASPVPVLLVPGLGEDGRRHKDWIALQQLFERQGFSLSVALMPRAVGIDEGARALKKQVAEKVPRGRLHIIAKSMGGLIARKMLSDYPMSERVISLTTLSTPHRGTEVADALMGNGDGSAAGSSVFGVVGRELGTRFMDEFNKRVNNDPNIRYFSLGYEVPNAPICRATVSFWTAWTHQTILARGGGDNDGMVSVRSATWGEYLGTGEGEHIAQDAPVLSCGKLIWRDAFQRIIDNLKRQRLK